MADIREKIIFESDLTGIYETEDALKNLDGTLKVTLGNFDKSYAEAQDSIKDYNKVIEQSVKETTKAASESEKLQRSNRGLRRSFSGAVKSISIAGISVGQLTDAYKRSREGNLSFAQSLVRTGVSANKVRTSISVLGGAAKLLGGVLGGALLAGLTAITAILAKADPIVEATRKAFAGLSAGVSAIADRISGFIEAFKSIENLSIASIFGAAKDAVSGLGAEIRKETIAAYNLEAAFIALEKRLQDLDLQRVGNSRQIQQLERQISNERLSAEERIRLEERRAAIVQSNLTEELNARRELFAATFNGNKEVTQNVLAQIDNIARRGVSGIAEIQNKTANSEDREKVAGLVEDIISLENELAAEQFDNISTVRDIRQQAFEDYKARVEEQKRLEEEVARIREQTEQRLIDLQNQGLSGEAAIEADRKRALAEIQNLEDVAREAFKQAGKRFDIEDQFAQLRLETNRQVDKQISEFRLEQKQKEIEDRAKADQAIIETLSASAQEELTLEEFKAQEKARIQAESLKELRQIAVDEFGEGSLEVLQFDVAIQEQEQAATQVVKDAAARRLDERRAESEASKAIRDAEIALIRESGDEELELDDFKKRELLQSELQFLRDKQAILAEDPTGTEAQKELLDLQIQNLEQAIGEVGKLDLSPLERIKKGIADALGIEPAVLDELINQVGSIISNLADGISANVEREIAEYDRFIQVLDERIAETEGLLQEQLQLRQDGFANDAALFEQQLEEQNAARAKALAEKEELEKKAARQQLIADAAQQASALALAGAQLIAAEASKGVIGIALAVGGLAAAFSLFKNFKAQTSEIQNDIPEFRLGGQLVNGKVVGPSHEDGGIFVMDKQKQVYSIEGKEFVTNKNKTDQYLPALEAINSGAMDSADPLQALRLLGKRMPDPVNRYGRQIGNNFTRNANGIDMDELERRMRYANADVVSAIENRPWYGIDKDGNEIEIRATKFKRSKKVKR